MSNEAKRDERIKKLAFALRMEKYLREQAKRDAKK